MSEEMNEEEFLECERAEARKHDEKVRELEESLKIDLQLENARMARMGAMFVKEKENLNIEKCKKCIHGDTEGGCVTKQEAPFGSFKCCQNEMFEED